jgi:hypothetical protein
MLRVQKVYRAYVESRWNRNLRAALKQAFGKFNARLSMIEAAIDVSRRDVEQM